LAVSLTIKHTAQCTVEYYRSWWWCDECRLPAVSRRLIVWNGRAAYT